jgi:hypothetical protein
MFKLNCGKATAFFVLSGVFFGVDLFYFSTSMVLCQI